MPPWREDQFSAALYLQMAPFVQERVATMSEIPDMVAFFFLDQPQIDEASFAKVITNDPLGRPMLEGAIERYEQLATWATPALHATILELGEALGLPLRKSQAPIRCAVTGSLVGPPLFESLELLGREKTIERLRAALARPE